MWNKKKVLVTGSGGFIGSHLTEKLVNLGSEVTAFVRYNSRNDLGLVEILPEGIKKKLNIIQGNLIDLDAVRNAVKQVDIIFHLGALISIPYSYVHPRETIETNILGTFNVLSAVKEFGIDKIIHTSTSEVYGTAQYIPIDEKHPLQGQSPYSASKIAADKIAESFYLSYDLPIITVRPFNTYGPRQSARAVIPTIITQILTGNEVHLGSLTPKRDFTFVGDVVDGFIKIAESKNVIGEVINLGSGKEIAIGALAEKIINLVGKKCRLVHDAKRIRPDKSEVMELLSDISKAEKIAGWKPKIDINSGLKATIQYIESNISKYKTEIYTI